MFGFGKPKRRTVRDSDQVYISRARADAALLERVARFELPTVVTSFFPASLRRIEQQLVAQGREPVVLASRARPAAAPGASRGPWMLDANHLMLDLGIASWVVQTGESFRFLFVEHYPTLGAEAAALESIEGISATRVQRVEFYVGLDEPLMAVFGGERLVGLMQRLGMPPDEAISHPMVDKSIVNAQKKLERRVRSVQPVDSDAEWFRINHGGTG
jgi:hypothetical protein